MGQERGRSTRIHFGTLVSLRLIFPRLLLRCASERQLHRKPPAAELKDRNHVVDSGNGARCAQIALRIVRLIEPGKRKMK